MPAPDPFAGRLYVTSPVGATDFGLSTDGNNGLRFLSMGLPGTLTLSSVITQLGGTFPVDTSELLSLTNTRVTYVRGDDSFLHGNLMMPPGMQLRTGVSIPALGINNVPFTIPLTKNSDAWLDSPDVTLEVVVTNSSQWGAQ